MDRKTNAETEEFLSPYAEEMGLELLEAKWTSRGGELSLSVTVDKKGGVDLNTLEAFHHSIDGPLDEFDPTCGKPYTLNCSSAGLDRPFTTERDFLRHLGEEVEIRLYAPEEGKKVFCGTLLSCADGFVTLLADGAEKKFERAKIAKASLFIDI